MEEENKRHKSNSKGNTKKSNKNSKKNECGIKRPQTKYFLFCQEKKEKLKKKGDESKLTAKELGVLWKKLFESKKKPYKDHYEEEKKKYNRHMKELKNK